MKQLFLLSSVKTTGRFFQIFVAFSEKLDFTSINMIYLLLTHVSRNLISVLLDTFSHFWRISEPMQNFFLFYWFCSVTFAWFLAHVTFDFQWHDVTFSKPWIKTFSACYFSIFWRLSISTYAEFLFYWFYFVTCEWFLAHFTLTSITII